ncbi:MAG: TlpA family protein disulfide reductase [Nannocystis sp.]|uniref:TlpA family protein disulfide reductase n=1 Tax=Nannocystis sp. TaxID=1962667 RepID=UPI002427DCB0|nr:TlpA disulfide reductase family protein [Nannocystis sp.]MBK9752312.1 TlpA family protein disulfide reductase [Nannocystis sp.]
MIGLLGRVGGVLLAPRALLGSLPEGTGRSDGAALLLAYLLAVGLPGIAAAVADLIALGPLAGLSGLAQGLLPLLPWLLTASAVEWRLGDARAHRAGLCLCPLLVLAALAHLAALCGLELPGPGYLPALLGGLASLVLASAVRGAIVPRPLADKLSVQTGASELSPGPGIADKPSVRTGTSELSAGPASTHSAALAALLGLIVAGVVGVNAGLDGARALREWSTLAPVAAGDPVPDFDVALLDGGRLRAADLRGAPHLLIFWTTWCGVCEAEMPMYAALAARHPRLRVVAVNADRDGDVPALVRAYRDAHALAFPIALDHGALTRGFRVRMFPHVVVLDADGAIDAVFRGRSFERSLEAAITAAGG